MITSVLLTHSAGKAAATNADITLALLNDLQQRSLLLIDENVSRQFLESIVAWGNDAKIAHARKLIALLSTSGAIRAPSALTETTKCECGSSNTAHADVIVRGCDGCELAPSVTLSDWPMRGPDHLRAQSYEIEEGSPVRELLDQVLLPLTRYATAIAVTDRYLATSVAGRESRLAPSQQLGLSMLLHAIAIGGNVQRFSIVSGLQESTGNRLFPEQKYLEHIAQQLLGLIVQSWRPLKADWQPEIDVTIYSEKSWKQLHERSLSTNLGEIAIDNGIDWVSSRTERCEPRVFTLRKPVFRRYSGLTGTAHSPSSRGVAIERMVDRAESR